MGLEVIVPSSTGHARWHEASRGLRSDRRGRGRLEEGDVPADLAEGGVQVLSGSALWPLSSRCVVSVLSHATVTLDLVSHSVPKEQSGVWVRHLKLCAS